MQLAEPEEVRPEVEGFICVAPPSNLYDFSFLAPCPSSGLFVHGDQDRVAPLKEVMGLIEKLKTQRGIVIDRLTTNETYFFREPQHFNDLSERLRAHDLRERVGQRRHRGQRSHLERRGGAVLLALREQGQREQQEDSQKETRG